MFEELFSLQLGNLTGSNVKVAVHEVLYSGKLINVTNAILTLLITTDSYEKETREVFIPLSSIDYVQASVC